MLSEGTVTSTNPRSVAGVHAARSLLGLERRTQSLHIGTDTSPFCHFHDGSIYTKVRSSFLDGSQTMEIHLGDTLDTQGLTVAEIVLAVDGANAELISGLISGLKSSVPDAKQAFTARLNQTQRRVPEGYQLAVAPDLALAVNAELKRILSEAEDLSELKFDIGRYVGEAEHRVIVSRWEDLAISNGEPAPASRVAELILPAPNAHELNPDESEWTHPVKEYMTTMPLGGSIGADTVFSLAEGPRYSSQQTKITRVTVIWHRGPPPSESESTAPVAPIYFERSNNPTACAWSPEY